MREDDALQLDLSHTELALFHILVLALEEFRPIQGTIMAGQVTLQIVDVCCLCRYVSRIPTIKTAATCLIGAGARK